LAAILLAFSKTPTWSQAELARRAGVEPRALRRHLDSLVLAGWPLEREEDHPHAYWSVPKNWFPAGLLLEPEAAAALLHILVRTPPGPERTQLLKHVTSVASPSLKDALERVIPPRSSPVEEQYLPLVLDAVAERAPLRMRYVPASSGMQTERTIPVHRVLVGPPTRFIAWCHTQAALRWFRLDYVSTMSRSVDPFRDVDEGQVEDMVDASVGGFHTGVRVRVAFFVHQPDARWVASNLPDGLLGTPVDGGLLVEAATAGLLPVARFVVGLGAAAECRSEELAALVRQLAEGALRATGQS